MGQRPCPWEARFASPGWLWTPPRPPPPASWEGGVGRRGAGADGPPALCARGCSSGSGQATRRRPPPARRVWVTRAYEYLEPTDPRQSPPRHLRREPCVGPAPSLLAASFQGRRGLGLGREGGLWERPRLWPGCKGARHPWGCRPCLLPAPQTFTSHSRPFNTLCQNPRRPSKNAFS